MARKLYLGLGNRAKAFKDPFKTGGRSSLFHWLLRPVDGKGDPERMITRLWRRVYQLRPDLQHAFPDVFGKDRTAFVRWVVNVGRFEHAIDERLVPMLGVPSKTRNRIKTSVRQLYARVVFPREAILKPLARRLIGSNERTWMWLKRLHYRLSYESNVEPLTDGRDGGLGSRPFGVNVVGNLTSEKGMGASVRASLSALSGAGIPHVANNLVDTSAENRNTTSGVDEHPFAINLIHVNAEQIPFVAHRLARSHFSGRYNIGYWTWETSQFPALWRGGFFYLNEVWVPSTFVLEAVARVSNIPVVRTPHTISAEEMPSGTFEEANISIGTGRFMFLFVFDFMSYMERKNPLGLIEAFKRAFSDDEHVELVIKTMHADFAPAEFAALRSAAREARVSVLDRVWSGAQVKRALKQCDCFVSLHRSEGFGLALAEAMALGKPVIATGYSGNMDFMNAQNSLLVRHRLTELQTDCGPYRRGNQWADPDLDHAAELMRWVVSHPTEARAIGERAAQTIRESFSPSVVGVAMRRRLLTIARSIDMPDTPALEEKMMSPVALQLAQAGHE